MTPDVVVVGLGAMGSATLYQLARRGARVIGIDRFGSPHDRGSSHGESRITRQAIGEGEEYVPFVLRSHEIWRELEAETGQKLFEACGVIVIAPGTGESSHHGKPDFVARSTEVAAAFDIPHETMTGAEAARRVVVASDLPAFADVVRDGESALLVPPSDVNALAGAINRLREDAALRARLAECAYERVMADYTWDARVNAILEKVMSYE